MEIEMNNREELLNVNQQQKLYLIKKKIKQG